MISAKKRSASSMTSTSKSAYDVDWRALRDFARSAPPSAAVTSDHDRLLVWLGSRKRGPGRARGDADHMDDERHRSRSRWRRLSTASGRVTATRSDHSSRPPAESLPMAYAMLRTARTRSTSSRKPSSAPSEDRDLPAGERLPALAAADRAAPAIDYYRNICRTDRAHASHLSLEDARVATESNPAPRALRDLRQFCRAGRPPGRAQQRVFVLRPL